jgi:hypothetical protein
LVSFHLVPSTPSFALPFHFLLSSLHYSTALKCTSSCTRPAQWFRFWILLKLHHPLFLFLLPQVPWGSCTVRKVFHKAGGPPFCVFLSMHSCVGSVFFI